MKFIKPIYILIGLVFNIVFFMFGIQYGIYQFGICDSPYKAYIAAVQLENIKNQKYELITNIQESMLTDEIVNYGEFLDHGKPWLFWSFIITKPIDFMGGEISKEKCIEKAIKYRKENPIQMPYDLSICTGENNDSEFCRVIIKRQFYYGKALQLQKNQMGTDHD